ncbi:MAG: hypothetical protein KME33_07540 [Aetokthonos hydrillicola CCALA 1050]|nr:hypothetical protein [Aetokthonos hydrillicola CCALA 1050]
MGHGAWGMGHGEISTLTTVDYPLPITNCPLFIAPVLLSPSAPLLLKRLPNLYPD